MPPYCLPGTSSVAVHLPPCSSIKFALTWVFGSRRLLTYIHVFLWHCLVVSMINASFRDVCRSQSIRESASLRTPCSLSMLGWAYVNSIILFCIFNIAVTQCSTPAMHAEKDTRSRGSQKEACGTQSTGRQAHCSRRERRSGQAALRLHVFAQWLREPHGQHAHRGHHSRRAQRE